MRVSRYLFDISNSPKTVNLVIKLAKLSASNNPLKKKYGTVRNLIIQRQEELGLPNTELNDQLGFKSPNVVSQIRNGPTRLPIGSIEAAARELDVDLKDFLALYLEEFEPEYFDLFCSTIGENLESDELVLIKAFRKFKKTRRQAKGAFNFDTEDSKKLLFDAFISVSEQQGLPT